MKKITKAGKIINAGVVNYSEALSLMKSIVEIKRNKPWPEILLLLEHPAVITLGKSATTEDILCSDKVLKTNGINLYKVERGGQVTYHGPGQLVGYILMDLKKHNMPPSQLVNNIETAIIKTLSHYKIHAEQHDGHRGVWVGAKKIASIGIAVRGGITFHGFALNCNPKLYHFDFINPCGLTAGSMTSITQLSGQSISPDDVKQRVQINLETQIGFAFSGTTYDQFLTDVKNEQQEKN